MSRATPQMRNLAKLLMTLETGANKGSQSKTAVAFHVCDKLRPQLATWMGSAGFRALISRALALASREVPWLREVQVKADGSLEGLAALKVQLDPREIAEGRVALTAQLLGLLVAFIGEDLTRQLIREVWPRLTHNDLDFGGG